MEDIDTCYRHPLGFDVFKTKFWNAPDISSPDFLNTCGSKLINGSIPYTALGGFQYPRTGNSFVGVGIEFLKSDLSKRYLEYIQGKLITNLKVSHKYRFRCFYNIGLSSCSVNCVLNNIGVSFTDTISNDNDLFSQKINLPHSNFINNKIITYETENWIPFEFEFIADKQYSHFFLGIMDTMNIQFNLVDTCKSNIVYQTYIFFDDFSLIDLTEPQEYKPHISNVFTPNGDGKNDEYISYWELDPPEKFSMKIYNRWGAKLFDTNSIFNGWDGKYLGNEVPEGAYFAQIIYTLDGVEHKINQPLYLLR